MDLIVAEKPSVARDIARVVGATRRGDGCFEGPRHVVTWCIGHLVELEEPAHYDARWKAWRLDTLPMVPERFETRPSKGTRAQWNVVRNLLRDRRFGRVVNACDAGREGELIFRLCYELAGSRLPMSRLWVSSLTDAALRAALAKLAPGSRYDALADAARCRSEADWLVGLNATRALTVRSRTGAGRDGALLSVGRVQTPTLAMVVEREQRLREFVPRDYWEVFGAFTAGGAASFRARWAHDGRSALATRDLADAVARRAASQQGAAHDARVESAQTRPQRVPPPLLFDLTTLQRRANTRFGWPAQRTLDVAQALYETHKAITYPRTDSRHLSNDLRGEVPDILDALASAPAYAATARALRQDTPRLGRRVFDDAKVSDHHAIIPTAKAPARLSPDEGRLYDLVARSFLAAFMPDAEFELTTIVVVVGEAKGPAPEAPPAPKESPDDEPPPERFVETLPPPPDRFIARGRVRRVAGWQDIAGFDDRDDPQRKGGAPQALPQLAVGQRLGSRYAHEAKRTQPPRRYTEATLLGAMESAGKDVDDEELRAALKDSGLGTPATRASIIETLLRRGYLVRQQKALAATPTGEALVAAIPVPELRSPELTGRWEARLARMARGEEQRARFMADIVAFVRSLVDGLRGSAGVAVPPADRGPPPPAPPPREPWGRGARTSGRSKPGGASGRTTPPAPRSPTPAARATTRARKPSPPSPTVHVGEGPGAGAHVATAGARVVGAPLALACPACAQGTLVTGRRAWGCSRWREGCALVIPFEFAGRALTDAQLRDLVTRGATRASSWVVAGEAARARLVLDARATPPSLSVEAAAAPAPRSARPRPPPR